MKNKKSILVTGGTGFLGSALVRRLVSEGHSVRVFDNGFRSDIGRLNDIANKIDYYQGDIRDAEAVAKASQGMETIFHLAFVNGTEFFYQMPELVLEVGVKGMINVLDACAQNKISELFVASSSEVYHHPREIPTPEDVPLVIPDPHNPRYSYSAGKIISEMLTLHNGAKSCERVVLFRPHNVYGPDMGWEHVLPQFTLRMKKLCDQQLAGTIKMPIQGSGQETRAFCYVDDFTDGLIRVMEQGEHLGIYHIGTNEEVSIKQVAMLVGEFFGRKVEVVPGPEAPGGTPRRCPDIGKIQAFGYKPGYSLEKGMPLLCEWYVENSHLAPSPEGD